MVMFTPMNGRRNFARMKRKAIQEWNHERNDEKSVLLSKELYQIFFDSVRFYLHFQRNRRFNFALICKQRHVLLGQYSSKSQIWRFILAHILDGILELGKEPTSCVTPLHVYGNDVNF